MKEKANAKMFRKIAALVNVQVYDGEVPLELVRFKMNKGFIEDHAVGMCEYHPGKARPFLLKFSDEVPAHWLEDWERRAVALVAHEMAHILQVIKKDKNWRGSADSHGTEMFLSLRKKFAKRTGFPIKYFCHKKGWIE